MAVGRSGGWGRGNGLAKIGGLQHQGEYTARDRNAAITAEITDLVL